ncbi:MAG: hypothetical protein A3C06_02480 [Candidatus Taylorbacteria bacterium RIFCSPHIGHO2_02_FULL_46_13]|uniref:histidine kinase n=1 Tax=Candidatus Taylorbacteria bacterium RIFCSPHIGHO2_02_FULL_46_13 TaxID=1802312 RepID=A0A1G2MQZ3_9BACT|nr:MAG: hypothetical protein A3C06_02480 [Candidatus Taylorbacteria bacterium RIFCSPHIGHO2_02_FULL_46_13]
MQYLILFFSVLNVLLGVIILIHSKHEKDNVTFLAFAFSASIWTFNNFYLRLNPEVSTIRISYGLGIIVATAGLVWSYFFLKKELPNFVKVLIFPVSVVFFLVTLFSNRIVEDIYSVEQFGYEGKLGVWFNFYSAYFSIIIILIVYNFIKQLLIEKDPSRQSQIWYVLGGAFFFSLVSSTVSFLIPTFFHTLRYTILDNLSFSIFLICIGYAILKYHLFNIKVIVTELFVFSLWSVILIRTTTSYNLQDLLINSGLLILTIVVGAFLIKSVIREVEQREKIQVLAKDLEETNDRQEKLIHFVGHEVKGYLTKGEYAFSEMVDGDFGTLPPETKILSTNALSEMRKGVKAVTDILKAANLKRGTVTYDKKPVDLRDVVREEIIKLSPQAKEKGLALTADIERPGNYTVNLDQSQFGEHVIRNLIDNSIKYTPTGSVAVRVSNKDGKVIFSVKDTGVGITDEDRAHLFIEGGTGKDSLKINVHSTGYGLYIAKTLVEAHNGKIRVESEGKGKGSTFFVELPAANSPSV